MADYTDDQIAEIKTEAGKIANAEAAASRHAAKEAGLKLEDLETEKSTWLKAQEEAKKTAAEKNGEFQVLYEDVNVKFETITVTLADREEQLQKYQERDEKDLTILLETVPDNFKTLITEDLPIAKRLEMAKTFSTAKPTAPVPRIPGGPADAITITRQSFDALSPAAKSKHVADGGRITD